MARTKGLVNCSVNFEVNKTAPLDSRTVINTVLELTQSETWADASGKVWLYDGLIVSVTENNSLYMLTGLDADPTAYSDQANWHKIGSDVVNNLTSTDDTKALAASQGKILSDKIEEIKTSLSSVYNFKGTKATFEGLPTDAQVGDVWNVVAATETTPAGTNFAWTGTEWDALGGDLSNYYTKGEVETAITNGTSELATQVLSNTQALLIVNGNDETAGSLANTLKTAKDYTDTQLTGYVLKVEGSSLIPADKLALIDTNASTLTTLGASVEANTAAIGILNGTATENGSVLNTVDTKINESLTWHEL